VYSHPLAVGCSLEMYLLYLCALNTHSNCKSQAPRSEKKLLTTKAEAGIPLGCDLGLGLGL